MANDKLLAEIEAGLLLYPLPWPAHELLHLLEQRLIVEDDGSLRIQHTDGTSLTVAQTFARAKDNLQ